jgi:hypothetical protein
MNIATKNMNKMNNGDTKARGAQELYRTKLLTMSGIQAKPTCLPLDLA